MWRGIPKQTPLPFLRSMTKIRLPRMRSTALHGRFPIRLLAEPAIPLYTNLDSETFLIGTIKELYRLRWGIETSFREFKYTIGLSCLHGKKTDFLLQEVLKMLYTQTVLAFARKTTAGSTEIANQSSDRKTKQPRLANKYYSSCWSASSSTAFTLPVCSIVIKSPTVIFYSSVFITCTSPG